MQIQLKCVIGLHDGLYFPWDNDYKRVRKLCDLLNKDVYHKRDFILEGGSVHADGESICMVTEKPVTITEEECQGLDACWDEPVRTPGERLAASYVNFYIANHTVVMPGFGDPANEKSKGVLRDSFPDRELRIFLSDR